jgi:hypothetical protein
MAPQIHAWLATFPLDDALRTHIAQVVSLLPEPVRSDLMTDPTFRLSDYDPAIRPFHIRVAAPSMRGSARSVILKRTLARRPGTFIHYVIAHELAHAHLRNQGRTPDEDPELAADALAALWGFPRPTDLFRDR